MELAPPCLARRRHINPTISTRSQWTLQVPVGQVTALALVLERTAKIDNVSEEMTAGVLRAGRTDMGSDPPIHCGDLGERQVFQGQAA